MKLCGEEVNDKDMLEKTFSTFHSTNMLLQQRYRKKGFTTYASLISCLLQAEQNDELLIKDSEMRSPGSTPLPNTHLGKKANKETNHVHDSQRSYERGRWHGQGRGRRNHGRGSRWNPYGRDHQSNSGLRRGTSKSVCYRCGTSNHWAKTCRTPNHLIELYQESLKEKKGSYGL